MRRKTAAGILMMVLALSGCGVQESAAQEQPLVAQEQQPAAEEPQAAETEEVSAPDAEPETAASDEEPAAEASADLSSEVTEPESDSPAIEGNGSYFVRIGTDVYFRTYEEDVFDSYALDGDFLSYAFAERGTSAICRYDEKTGEVSVVAEDNCTGKLYYCGDRFYYTNDKETAIWTATPDGEFGRFCPGSVAGVSENGKYIALWVDVDDDLRSIYVYNEEGLACNYMNTWDFMQVVFCGVMDNGTILFIGTDAQEKTGLYDAIPGLPSEIVYLGSVPLENIFVDISCDRFFTQGEDVYCVIGYYGGSVLILENYLYVRARANESDSMEVLEQGERNEAIFDEPLYLTHSIFGSKSQRKFLYGDLLYRDDNMQERVLVQDFIPYEDREHRIMQTGEALGGYAYLCVAEAERVPEEDYKVYQAYSYKDMYYLRIPLDGSGKIETIYGPSWDDTRDFANQTFLPMWESGG